jgi:hypothetical protein
MELGQSSAAHTISGATTPSSFANAAGGTQGVKPPERMPGCKGEQAMTPKGPLCDFGGNG